MNQIKTGVSRVYICTDGEFGIIPALSHAEVLAEALVKNPALKITPLEKKLLAELTVKRLKGQHPNPGIPERAVIEMFGPVKSLRPGL